MNAQHSPIFFPQTKARPICPNFARTSCPICFCSNIFTMTNVGPGTHPSCMLSVAQQYECSLVQLIHATWSWSLASLLKQPCNDAALACGVTNSAINLPTQTLHAQCMLLVTEAAHGAFWAQPALLHDAVEMPAVDSNYVVIRFLAQTQQAIYGCLFVKACLSGETSCKIRKGHINILMQVTVMGSMQAGTKST